jgi:hypothetical protein
LSRLLFNVPHCLRRRFSLASGRRSQRGPREFHHGLLALTQLDCGISKPVAICSVWLPIRSDTSSY